MSTGYFIIIIVTGILFVAIAIGVDLLIAYHWHKCPYCGKRMSHDHTEENKNGVFHHFHCPNCGAWDSVNEEHLIQLLEK